MVKGRGFEPRPFAVQLLPADVPSGVFETDAAVQLRMMSGDPRAGSGLCALSGGGAQRYLFDIASIMNPCQRVGAQSGALAGDDATRRFWR